MISAAPVRALSAIGSAILPKSVTSPRLRASFPSSKSVTEATPNAASAASRQPVLPRRPAGRTTKTGTERKPGHGQHVGYVDQARRAQPERARRQVGPCGHALALRRSYRACRRGRPRPTRSRAPSRSHPMPACRPRGASRTRRLRAPGAAARPSYSPSPSSSSTSDPSIVSPDPVGGPLRHELLGQVGELAPPGGRSRPRPAWPVRRRGLGAVLVGVAEDADRVQPRLAQEQLELGQVGGGLAGEADDEVGPDAGLWAELPDLVDQAQ